MAINREFHNWQQHLPVDDPRYNRCSPNLLAIGSHMMPTFGMSDLGCYGERDVRAGASPSSHSHGAARDLGYGNREDYAVSVILPWLIDNSLELHVQAIHDYHRSRIWRAGRTPNINDAHTLWWRAQTPSASTGMGQSWAHWFHIETTQTGWFDISPVVRRLTDPTPTEAPPMATLKGGSVRLLDTRLNGGKLAPREIRRVGVLPPPADWARAVIVDIGVADTDAPGFIVAWDGQGDMPNTSAQDYPPGSTYSNTWHVPISGNDVDGWGFSIYSLAGAHIVVDLQGYDSVI